MKRREDRKVSRAQLRNVVVETTQSMGAAFGEGIARYHAEKVEPLEARIARLETPLWRRLWAKVRRVD